MPADIPLVGEYSIVFSADEFDVDLFAVFVLEYGTPTGEITLSVEIQTDVIISATSTSVAAFTIGADWPTGTTILIVNNGIIAGRGGNGGQGWGENSIDIADRNGTDGGLALDAAGWLVDIDNQGWIIGGGGGGGGGRGDYYLSGSSAYIVTGSGGAGGWPYGQGGLAGTITPSSYAAYETGTNGGTAGHVLTFTGSNYRGLHGGAYSGKSLVVPLFPSGSTTITSGAGGNGGNNPGQAVSDYSGDSGGSGTANLSGAGPGSGGAAGDCVIGNTNITWVNTGYRYGAIT
jgi:hypothetical protein